MNYSDAVVILEGIKARIKTGPMMYVYQAEAVDLAIKALNNAIWYYQIWHCAKTENPKANGLYYVRIDDTSAMYAAHYRDGIWTIEGFGSRGVEVVWWTDYKSFGV